MCELAAVAAIPGGVRRTVEPAAQQTNIRRSRCNSGGREAALTSCSPLKPAKAAVAAIPGGVRRPGAHEDIVIRRGRSRCNSGGREAADTAAWGERD